MFPGTPGGPDQAGRRLYFSAGAKLVVVETAVPEFYHPTRQLFPAYEVPSPACQETDIVDVHLGKSRGGYSVASPDSSDVFCKTRMDAIVALEFALSRQLAASLTEYAHLHASGTVVGGKAVLALGTSGAGKSSLAVSLLARGYPTLGDDIILLGSDAAVSPFKRLLKASPEVLGELGIDPTDTVFWDAAWPEAWYQPAEQPGWAESAPVAAIVLVRYDPDSPLELNPLPAPEALNVVLHSVMTTGTPPRDGFDRLFEVVRVAKTFRLTFSSSIEAAEVLCGLTN